MVASAINAHTIRPTFAEAIVDLADELGVSIGSQEFALSHDQRVKSFLIGLVARLYEVDPSYVKEALNEETVRRIDQRLAAIKEVNEEYARLKRPSPLS